VVYTIGSQSAPYGAPGLRERNLGAPQAIRLLSIFFFRNLLWGSVNHGQSLHGLHNTKSLRTPGIYYYINIFFLPEVQN